MKISTSYSQNLAELLIISLILFYSLRKNLRVENLFLLPINLILNIYFNNINKRYKRWSPISYILYFLLFNCNG